MNMDYQTKPRFTMEFAAVGALFEIDNRQRNKN